LANALNRPLDVINLADWVSLNDDVTCIDLAMAMHQAWQKLRGHAKPRSHDVLVHSTGALVVRDWMTRHYQPGTVPVKRFVQLAPANFGSPLAHKGRSVLGRIVKGGFGNRFQTGTQLLKGLELASPYTWKLAERDLFPDGEAPGRKTQWYGQNRLLASVLVGLKTYDGLAGAFAGNGSDGTAASRRRISRPVASSLILAIRVGWLSFRLPPRSPCFRLTASIMVRLFRRPVPL
jgi:hypothetical protein